MKTQTVGSLKLPGEGWSLLCGAHLVLAESQSRALQLLNDGIIKVAVLLPELQELVQRETCEAEAVLPSHLPA